MPRKQKSITSPSGCGYAIRFIPVIESEFDARERRERIQSCLTQMFIRASTRGRKSEAPGEENVAA